MKAWFECGNRVYVRRSGGSWTLATVRELRVDIGMAVVDWNEDGKTKCKIVKVDQDLRPAHLIGV